MDGGGGPLPPGLDTDDDGLPDYLENELVSDPNNADDPIAGGAGGTDLDDATGPAGDGISDALEFFLISSGAAAPVDAWTDSDVDGAPDFIEVFSGTGIFDQDSPVIGGGDAEDANGPAGDGISDAFEQLLIALGSAAPVTPASDLDGDGVPDFLEVLTNNNPADSDSPLLGGGSGLDSDDVTGSGGDGISDALEATLIAVGAAAPIELTTDSDGDGIPDAFETLGFGSNSADADAPLSGGSADADDATGLAGDGISDALEFVLIRLGASGPISPATDTDLDGLPDVTEVRFGYDPFDVNLPVFAGSGDDDDTNGPAGDGVSDAVEFHLVALGIAAPITDTTDGDADGVLDAIEVQFGADPTDSLDPNSSLLDLDNDGVPANLEFQIGSSPFDLDDPVTAGGSDSNDATGPTGDGISDALEQTLIALGAVAPVDVASDTDGDQVPDFLEAEFGSGPADENSPAPGGDLDANDATGPADDGISDGLEQHLVDRGAIAPVDTTTDSDGDGAPDYLEIRTPANPFDSDSPLAGGDSDLNTDGILDGLEAVLIALGAETPVTLISETDGDGLPDTLEVVIGGDPFEVNLPTAGGATDLDDDGLSLALETYMTAVTLLPDPTPLDDQDGDLAPDYLELLIQTDPFDGDAPVVSGSADTDGDRISDAAEFCLLLAEAIDPVTGLSDDDTDGAPIVLELEAGTVPLVPDHPVDNGALALDTANATGPAGDSISDALEAVLILLGSTTPVNASTESDGDGLPDYLEALLLASNPFDSDSPTVGGALDTDDTTGPAGDGIPDGLEVYLSDLAGGGAIDGTTDSDSDGVSDVAEVINGTDPNDGSSTPPTGSAPIASSIAISGTATVGETLTGSYVYSDADGQPEGNSTFQWYRNGSPIAGATGLTYDLVPSDGGASIALGVTPSAQLGVPQEGAEALSPGSPTVTAVPPTSADVVAGVSNAADVINAASADAVAISVAFPPIWEGEEVRVRLDDGTNPAIESSPQTVPAGLTLSFTGLDATTLDDGDIDVFVRIEPSPGSPQQYAGTQASKDTVAPLITAVTTLGDGGSPPGLVTSSLEGTTVVQVSAGDDASATIDVTVSDGVTSVDAAQVVGISSGAAQTAALDLTSLSDGSLTITATVADAAGNSTQLTGSAIKRDLQLATGLAFELSGGNNTIGHYWVPPGSEPLIFLGSTATQSLPTAGTSAGDFVIVLFAGESVLRSYTTTDSGQLSELDNVPVTVNSPVAVVAGDLGTGVYVGGDGAIGCYTLNPSTGGLTAVADTAVTGTTHMLDIDVFGSLVLHGSDQGLRTLAVQSDDSLTLVDAAFAGQDIQGVSLHPSGQLALALLDGGDLLTDDELGWAPVASDGSLGAEGQITVGATDGQFDASFYNAAGDEVWLLGDLVSYRWNVDLATPALSFVEVPLAMVGARFSFRTEDDRAYGSFASATALRLVEFIAEAASTVEEPLSPLANDGSRGNRLIPLNNGDRETVLGPIYALNPSSDNINVLNADPSTAALTAAAGSPFTGTSGVEAAAIHPAGEFLAAGGGATILVYPLDPVTRFPGASVGAGSSSSTVSGLAFDPTGRFLYVIDDGADELQAFGVNPSTGALSAIGSALGTAAGPSDLAVSPDGRFLYVACETGNTVETYRLDVLTGGPTLDSTAAVPGGPAHLAVQVEDRFLAVGTRTDTDVELFSRDLSTGALTNVDTATFASPVNDLAFSADGDLLYVALAGSISSFFVDHSGDTLLSSGSFVLAGDGVALVADRKRDYLFASDSAGNVDAVDLTLVGLPAAVTAYAADAPGIGRLIRGLWLSLN